MIPNRFPLPTHARPAFACRSVLSNIHSLQKNTKYGEFDAMKVLSIISNLRLAQHFIHTKIEQQQVIPKEFLRVLNHTCVFMSAENVEAFESKMKWKSWDTYSDVLKDMAEVLDRAVPSNFYIPSETKYGSYFWEHWLTETPPQELIEILQYSENVWIEFFKEYETCNSAFLETAYKLGGMMNMSPAHCQAWGMWEEWVDSNSMVFHELVNLLPKDAGVWLNAFSYMLKTPMNVINDLFGMDGMLTAMGLYKPIEPKKGRLFIPWGQNNSLQEWMTEVWSALRAKNPESDTLEWGYLFSPIEGDKNQNLPSYLNAIKEWNVNCRPQKNPPKILVVGSEGSGKSTFVQELLSSQNIVGFELKKPKKEAFALANWALHIKRAPMIFKGGAVLKEDGFKDLLTAVRVPIIVETNDKDLKAASQDVLRNFNVVINLDTTTFQQRLSIAKHYFSDEHLALKVARALRNPTNIARAAYACELAGEYSWAVVNQSISAFSAVTEEGASFVTVLDDDKSQNLPPLGQSPKWDGLFKKLSHSFDEPEKFKKLGVESPKGAILLGPPGTGKTLFARHLAKKLTATCLSVDCSKLKDNVARLFEVARAHSPCVVILDEGDVVLTPKQGDSPNPTCLAFTSQLDGVEDLEGVLFIVTSNLSQYSIHPPLMRSGRLSEVHEVDVPLSEERLNIWRAYLKDRPLDEPLEEALLPINRASRGFTGADIKEVLRTASNQAYQEDLECVTVKLILNACDQVRWSPATGEDSVSEEERFSVAVHEAGHALIAWRYGLDVLRLTIRHRQDALGSVQFLAQEKMYRQSRKNLVEVVQLYLGGIAAEQAIFGAYGLGGSSDLKKVRSKLTNAFSMNGLGAMGPLSAPVGIGQEGVWSEGFRDEIEAEARHWAQSLFDEAVEWFTQHQDLVKELAHQLLKEYDMSVIEADTYMEKMKQLISQDKGCPVPVWQPLASYDKRLGQPLVGSSHMDVAPRFTVHRKD